MSNSANTGASENDTPDLTMSGVSRRNGSSSMPFGATTGSSHPSSSAALLPPAQVQTPSNRRSKNMITCPSCQNRCHEKYGVKTFMLGRDGEQKILCRKCRSEDEESEYRLEDIKQQYLSFVSSLGRGPQLPRAHHLSRSLLLEQAGSAPTPQSQTQELLAAAIATRGSVLNYCATRYHQEGDRFIEEAMLGTAVSASDAQLIGVHLQRMGVYYGRYWTEEAIKVAAKQIRAICSYKERFDPGRALGISVPPALQEDDAAVVDENADEDLGSDEELTVEEEMKRLRESLAVRQADLQKRLDRETAIAKKAKAEREKVSGLEKAMSESGVKDSAKDEAVPGVEEKVVEDGMDSKEEAGESLEVNEGHMVFGGRMSK